LPTSVSGHPQPERLRLRTGSLEWRLVEGEVVAVDLERSEYLLVNRTGAALWRLLAEGSSPGELAADLVERYGLAPRRAEADVEVFVAALAQRGLLEP
jgi:hypothetical protein